MINTIYINAHIIDTLSGYNEIGDIIINQDNIILDWGKNLPRPDGYEIINCQGKIIMPAFVDMRITLRDCSNTQELTKIQELAAANGVGAIAILPNGKYPITDKNRVNAVLRQPQNHAVKFYCYGAMTKDLKGEFMAELGLMKMAGALGFTDSNFAPSNSLVQLRIMEYAYGIDALLVQHPADNSLNQGVANDAPKLANMGLSPSYPMAEAILIARDCAIYEKIGGGRYHFGHISTKAAVDLIREAKAKGLGISCDTAPHYFCYNHDMVKNYATEFKTNPPLRSEEDRLAIIAGLKDGTIDAIASDHHSLGADTKNTTFALADFGMASLPNFWQNCLESSGLNLQELQKLLAFNPSKILRINDEFGAIIKNKPAHLTIISDGHAKLLVR